MRKAQDHGPCECCGKSAPGLYFAPAHSVIDCGPNYPPIETGDLGEPVLCDDCDQIRRIESGEPARMP